MTWLLGWDLDGFLIGAGLSSSMFGLQRCQVGMDSTFIAYSLYRGMREAWLDWMLNPVLHRQSLNQPASD
jgi:hypothetical protein